MKLYFPDKYTIKIKWEEQNDMHIECKFYGLNVLTF